MSETKIEFDATYQFCWLKNIGTGDCYVSDYPNIVAEDDDVALLTPGEAVRMPMYNNAVYVLGDTVIEAHAQNFSDAPFAWNEAGEGGGSDITVESLSVNENGTYTAPSGTAYSPVTVSVPTGLEIILRSDWNALTTAQKQAKGLVAIQDASTGFKRGEFVNGADYIEANKYIPYSNNDSVLCEAYADNFDGTSDTWGVGASPLQYVDSTKKPSLDISENAVFVQCKTNQCIPYIDRGLTNKSSTIYFIAKIYAPSTSYERIISNMYSDTLNSICVVCRNNNQNTIMLSAYGDDTGTSYSCIDYCVGCLKITSGTPTTGKLFLYNGVGNIYTLSKNINGIGQYITLCRYNINNTTSNQYPSDSYFKYFAAVDGAETDTVIENNIMNLYNEFLAE